ncbi:MAG: serine/threonine protein kinase [Ruminococcus sp.]|nr:serine/threonine protein kinase [Ruminococcus sp.]
MAEIGDIIAGRYRILEEIQRGGFSIVYLAIDMELRGTWALKEINRSRGISQYEKALREARLMSEFRCQGIPLVTNILELEYEETRLAYIVMEYIPGKSLQDIINERKDVLPENFVVHAAIAITDILNYLHTSEPPVIHRDIKPANIIYNESDKSFWLLDFGEAKLLNSDSDRDERATGTRGFMAPEQYAERLGGSQCSNQRSDIFSLGASMFYMITGRVSERSNVNNQYYSIWDINTKVSSTLNQIVAKAMMFRATDRYENVLELKADLLECTEEVQKRMKSAWRNIKRSALVFSMSMIMLIGGVVCQGIAKNQNNRSYDNLIASASSQSGDMDKKIEDALSAIELKSDNLEPYILLKELYESDGRFTIEEEAKLQAVITPNRSVLQTLPDYSDFAYQVGIMYLIYYTETSESYIKAIDWFSDVKNNYQSVAEVYLKIGEFDRDITKKLSTGEESGEFRTQWQSLDNALTQAGNQNNDLLQLSICKKAISAMDEYCMKFKKDGITKEEMENMFEKIKSYISNFIPSTEEYLDEAENIDFSKYYDSLKNEQDKTGDSVSIAGTDNLFMQIYPFINTVPVEIEKTYE